MIGRLLRRAVLPIALVASATLLACGGGSSSEEPPPPVPLAPGTLDPSFRPGGKVITSFGASARAKSVAIAPDGKIVLAGYVDEGGRRKFALARYNVDGSLDASFGASGKLVTAIGTADSEFACVVVQPDGKIVAAGSYFPDANLSCALARFNGDGTPDTQFGVAGIALLDYAPGVAPICAAVAIQRDGKIVAAVAGTLDVTVLRMNTDGSIDGTFGSNGVGAHPRGVWNIGLLGSSVAIQPDGKIVVLAQTLFIFKGETYGSALVRFRVDGTSEPEFGQDGLVFVQNFFNEYGVGQVALSSNGGIIATAGPITRFLTSGALDPAFDRQAGGIVTSLALQQNGKIVGIQNPGFQVFRLIPDGGFDLGFGDSGIVDTIIGTDRTAYAVAIQGDGMVVVAGQITTTVVDAAGTSATQQNFGLARYIGDPVALGAR